MKSLEKTCDNCKFSKKKPFGIPCFCCEYFSYWAPIYSEESKEESKTVEDLNEKACVNCKFCNKYPYEYPCSHCKSYSNWISLYSKTFESEPEPTEDGQVVLYQVLKDLIDRAEVGKKECRTYLKTNNERSALANAYEEALDLCVYLKQVLLESQK